MIFDAFVRLVNEYGIDRITVQQIADEAMINRATFYAHFRDKQDLYDQIFDTVMQSFEIFTKADIFVGDNELHLATLEKTLTEVFENLEQQKELFYLICDGSKRVELMQRLQQMLSDTTSEFLTNLKIEQNGKVVPNEFIFSYITSTLMGTLNWWLKEDKEFRPDHLAHFMIQLIENSHLTVLGIQLMDE
ncbi:TetR family transcriptional regulator [Paucilactobacillus suebicus DSM 5007 = KCTC 3549]|uniref:TetR family transcriptional regulator n=2 Tax=Paucilactobacillus suebicus TaxID=152335 RepID=A0A0R1W1P8_9LACO|nr:TetR family transcriptional regulator [Paucilactobacillus suebicus DSM 5007 = KCTC 3549]